MRWAAGLSLDTPVGIQRAVGPRGDMPLVSGDTIQHPAVVQNQRHLGWGDDMVALQGGLEVLDHFPYERGTSPGYRESTVGDRGAFYKAIGYYLVVYLSEHCECVLRMLNTYVYALFTYMHCSVVLTVF